MARRLCLTSVGSNRSVKPLTTRDVTSLHSKLSPEPHRQNRHGAMLSHQPTVAQRCPEDGAPLHPFYSIPYATPHTLLCTPHVAVRIPDLSLVRQALAAVATNTTTVSPNRRAHHRGKVLVSVVSLFLLTVISLFWARGEHRKHRELTSEPSDCSSPLPPIFSPTYLHILTLFTYAPIFEVRARFTYFWNFRKTKN